MQTQIYQQHIKPISIDKQQHIVNLIVQTTKFIDEQQYIANLIMQKGIFKPNKSSLEKSNNPNWRKTMSEKVKILVSEEELIQPMTDIWEDYI
ncbi:hypothetical protein QUF50_00495 [Thiotrichales bacterium HSG1]|nr:hypothetical protein [Thiotrichales bacterium HSG1]